MALSIPTAGQINKRVELVRRTDLPEGESQAYQNETSLGFYWSKIEPVGGAIYYGATQIDERVTHRVWLRSYKDKTLPVDIQHGVLIRYKDLYYRPVRVMDADGSNAFTVIECRELGAVAPVKSSLDLVSEVLDG